MDNKTVTTTTCSNDGKCEIKSCVDGVCKTTTIEQNKVIAKGFGLFFLWTYLIMIIISLIVLSKLPESKNKVQIVMIIALLSSIIGTLILTFA